MQFSNQWGIMAAVQKLHRGADFCILGETAHNLLCGLE